MKTKPPLKNVLYLLQIAGGFEYFGIEVSRQNVVSTYAIIRLNH